MRLLGRSGRLGSRGCELRCGVGREAGHGVWGGGQRVDAAGLLGIHCSQGATRSEKARVGFKREAGRGVWGGRQRVDAAAMLGVHCSQGQGTLDKVGTCIAEKF